MQLTGLGRVAALRKIVQAPFDMQRRLIELIDFEAAESRAGRPARIVVKMNAISEPKIIQALYRASQAGVSIDMIVRGVCCLRPGVPGVSENIRVRSIIGRFLEHCRVSYFHHAGSEITYCASADWMQRNFFSRVEICFPIEEQALSARVRADSLTAYLADDVHAWDLQSDGKYWRAQPGAGATMRSAQDELLSRTET
jgi:polyphosphate kinase